jgi:hypothetical protein
MSLNKIRVLARHVWKMFISVSGRMFYITQHNYVLLATYLADISERLL